MPNMIQLRAMRPFSYGKHRLAVGEVFEVNEKLGAVFIKEGRAAELSETVSPVDLPAEVMSRAKPQEVEEKSAAPLYQTRHMEAERPSTVSVDSPAPKKRGRPVGWRKLPQS